MRFHYGVGDGQLDLMHAEPLRLVFWRKAEFRPEMQQDGRGLADDDIAVTQEGWRERWGHRRRVVGDAIHRVVTVFSRNIAIFGAGILECQPDEFAASLNAGPVIEFVNHATQMQFGRAAFPADRRRGNAPSACRRQPSATRVRTAIHRWESEKCRTTGISAP